MPEKDHVRTHQRPPEATNDNHQRGIVMRARYTRRLSDKIAIAFHNACDERDIEVAERLLNVLENMINRPLGPLNGSDRRSKESLVAAHERLWLMRHPLVV